MKSIVLAILLVFSAAVLHAQPGSTCFRVEVEQEVAGDNLWMDFYIRDLTGNNISLASSNFSVFVSDQYLDLSGIQVVDSAKGVFDFNAQPNHYWNMSVGTKDDFFSFNVINRTDAPNEPSQKVTGNRHHIGRVSIPITDHSGFNTVTWRTAPAAVLNWQNQNIIGCGEFITPAPNFPLCNVPSAPSVAAQGPTEVCNGEQVVLTTDSSSGNIWFRDGVELTGVNGGQLVVNDPGRYTVATTNFSCESDPSAPVEIKQKPSVQKPVIVKNPATLTTNADGTLQWYFNGQPIQGATDSSLTPTQNGSYTVEVTGECGSAMSDPVQWTSEVTSAADPLSRTYSLSAFPNPYPGETTISYSLAEAGDVLIQVYDLQGRTIATLVDEAKSPGKHEVGFDARARGHAIGTYLVKFSTNGASKTLKLVETE